MPSKKVYKSNGNSRDRTPPKYREDVGKAIEFSDIRETLKRVRDSPVNTGSSMPILTDESVDLLLAEGVIPNWYTVSPKSAEKIRIAGLKAELRKDTNNA